LPGLNGGGTAAAVHPVAKLKPDKAQGPDGVHPVVLRAVATPLASIRNHLTRALIQKIGKKPM